jgi:hypothetical protein
MPGGADPTVPETYKVWQLQPAATKQTPRPWIAGDEVPVTAVFFDAVLRQTVGLELGAAQNDGQTLLVEVDGYLTSSHVRIPSNGIQHIVEVGGKNKKEEVSAQKSAQKKEADAKAKDEQLKKILQPPYAIGMGIITRDDYNNLKNEYFSQSELSLGLILPLVLIVLGLVLTPQLGLAPPIGEHASLLDPQSWLKWAAWGLMCLFMALLSQMLFMIGMERYHKFRLEVKLLILGNWQKQQDAKKDSKATSSASPSAIQAALAKAIAAGSLQKLNVKVDTSA